MQRRIAQAQSATVNFVPCGAPTAHCRRRSTAAARVVIGHHSRGSWICFFGSTVLRSSRDVQRSRRWKDRRRTGAALRHACSASEKRWSESWVEERLTATPRLGTVIRSTTRPTLNSSSTLKCSAQSTGWGPLQAGLTTAMDSDSPRSLPQPG